MADNHPIFRAGIRALIEEQSDLKVVGEVADGETCIVQAGLLRPDILITDLSMPQRDGFDVARWAAADAPDISTIILSMYSGGEFVAEARKLGVRAFVSKEDAGAELLAALKLEVPFYMSSSAGRAESDTSIPATSQSPKEILSGLSHSEINILRLVAQSKTSREISEIQGISERTVHTHRQNICTKLDLRGANSLMQFAIRNRKYITG